MATPIKSPFKFLDPYTLEDRDFFFGRDEEVEQLYEMMFDTNLVLIYGPSGAGKTSLIQCGLASHFRKTDWFDLLIRRREDINNSLIREIKRHAITDIPDESSLSQAVNSLYLDYFKPIYLIFDQFEELYLLGEEQERQSFIQNISELLAADLPCKLIFSMREEFIAHLYDFEKVVPVLFDHRQRIEPMSFANVKKVILGSAEKFNIRIENTEETIDEIIENVSAGRSGVQLSYLQVYLDRLYRKAHGE